MYVNYLFMFIINYITPINNCYLAIGNNAARFYKL